MRKIDRLGWAAGISFTSYGVRVGVRVNRPEVLPGLQKHFPPGWRPSAAAVVDRLYSLVAGGEGSRRGVRRMSLLYGDIERVGRTPDYDRIVQTFESDLRQYIAGAARRRTFVHAGAVGWRGRAVIIPGSTMSGKTTLVAELVRAGADYYSDEYAVLDARGRLHAFPKPLSIREDVTYRQTPLPVESLGGKAGSKPLPIAMVLLNEYRRGARWRPRRLSAGRGIMSLLAHTVGVRRDPEVALTTLERVVSGAAVLKGARGEAREIAVSILEQLEERKGGEWGVTA